MRLPAVESGLWKLDHVSWYVSHATAMSRYTRHSLEHVAPTTTESITSSLVLSRCENQIGRLRGQYDHRRVVGSRQLGLQAPVKRANKC